MVPLFNTNLFNIMCYLVTTFRILFSSFFEYVKLAKLAMVQIIGSVVDERCLSTLIFMKQKLHNMLTTHLPIIVHMFA
jgi:hypothetical protein